MIWSSGQHNSSSDYLITVSDVRIIIFFIKPYVHTLPAYIRDCTDFINKIATIKPTQAATK